MFKVRVGDRPDPCASKAARSASISSARNYCRASTSMSKAMSARSCGRSAKGGRITVAGAAGAYAASQNAGAHMTDRGRRRRFPRRAARRRNPRHVRRARRRARQAWRRRAGDRLRRGIIIIEGDADADLGSRMIAGTIIALRGVAGRCRLSQQARLDHSGASARASVRLMSIAARIISPLRACSRAGSHKTAAAPAGCCRKSCGALAATRRFMARARY